MRRAWLLLLTLVCAAHAQPVLQGVVPQTAKAGSTVTLSGSGFGADAERARVFFGPASAKVVQAQDGSLTVQVPDDAPKQAPVVVECDGQRSNAVEFNCAPSVRITVGKNPIEKGETTTGTFQVFHEDRPVNIQFTNATPNVVSFQGGDEQTVRTSGGAQNTYSFEILGKAGPRLYQVDYSWTIGQMEVTWTLPWSQVQPASKPKEWSLDWDRVEPARKP